ncbi:MAG: hypothetical protein ACRDYA_12765 [Egibacteraceae bacterium]
MRRISRRRRAELLRRAHRIRQEGQLAGWSVERIAETIRSELSEIRPLKAWRLAYGWTRPQVLDGIAALYKEDGLAVPPLNSSMLCRWEHGELPPNAEYRNALCRLYRAGPEQLGLATRDTFPARGGWYRLAPTMTANSDNSSCPLSEARR